MVIAAPANAFCAQRFYTLEAFRHAGFKVRALLNEPGFVNRMREEEDARCNCKHSNYCIARMYSIEMACHRHLGEELPACLKKEIEKIEAKG